MDRPLGPPSLNLGDVRVGGSLSRRKLDQDEGRPLYP